MTDVMSICLVCLRTDVELKPFNSKITDLHKALCAYHYPLASGDPTFCLDCQHLLEKFHKFKEKCVQAVKILQKWKMKTEPKEPLNQLHKLLPKTGLGLWSANNMKTFIFNDELGAESGDTASGPMLDLAPSSSKINLPWIISNMKIKPERMVQVNVVQSIPKSETSTEMISTNDIKKEMTSEGHSEDQNSNNVLETKEVTVEFRPEFKNNSEKDVELIENDKCVQSNVHFHELDYLDDDSIYVSDDGIELNDALNTTNLDYNKDIETDSSVNSDDIREIDKALEDSCVESDDNDVEVNKIKKYPTREKKTLAKMASIILTDDEDFTNNYEDNENYLIGDDDDDLISDDVTEAEEIDTNFPEFADTNEDYVKANKMIGDLENVNKELDSITSSYEMIMQDGDISLRDRGRSVRKKRKAKLNIGMMARKININFDEIQEQCENIIKTGNGELLDIRTKALKENLKIKFANYKELKSQSGVLIDKEHILNCLDGKVTEYLANWLWRAVKDTKDLTFNALKVLGLIQEKYQNSKYESVFEIEYTNTMEAKRREFQKRQTYQWYIEAKYKCENCYFAFAYANLLVKHKKLHEENAGNLVCAVCGVRNKCRKKHRAHLVLHEAVYKCKLCPMITYYRDTMKNHYDQHSGVKYRCVPCNKTFSSHSAYNTHRSYEHRRAHACTRCGRTFDTQDNLHAHGRTQHRGEPPTDGSTSVKCDECKLSFPSQQVYERHIRFSHGELNRWDTAKYLRKPKTKKVFNGKRKRTVLKKPVYTCPVCNTTGPSYGWLCSHGRWEHKKDLSEMYAKNHQYLCDVCGKGYGNKYNLRDHLNTHTGERPFACAKCPKRFHSAKGLVYHQQYHGPRSFVCELCGKKFHTQANLYTHVQAHIGIRRFECESCGKRFVNATTLKEHIKGVHLNVRRVRKRKVSDATVADTPAASGAKRQKARRATSTEESSDSD